MEGAGVSPLSSWERKRLFDLETARHLETAMQPEREYDRLQTALQLIREAYEVMNAFDSRVNIADWSKTAARLLDEFDITLPTKDPA
jgi:hypothetical protein